MYLLYLFVLQLKKIANLVLKRILLPNIKTTYFFKKLAQDLTFLGFQT